MRTIPAILAALCAVMPSLPGHAAEPTPAEPPGQAETSQPAKGAYQHLWIEFAGGNLKAPATAFVGLRDGNSTTVWFINQTLPGGVPPSGSYKLKLDAHAVKLTASGLSGNLSLRQVSGWAPMTRYSLATLTLEAKRSGADLTGTWTTQLAGGASTSGTFTGKLTEEDAIRAAQPFAAEANWPTYYGPYDGNRASAKGQALMEDIAQAKPLWRSEQPLGAGWGCGDNPTGRPFKTAAAGPCGGSSSPVFAGGRIFQFHFIPSGQADAELVAKTMEVTAKEAAKNKIAPEVTSLEKNLIIDGLRPFSDTVVTCIDPQTGATLWRTSVPRLSGNYQAHKWRGMNPTPTVIGDVVVVSDYGYNHLGLKADTGESLWIIPGGRKVGVGGQSAPVRPVAAAGLAILQGGELRAVKPSTGEVVWKAKAGGGEVLPWTSGGVDRLILINWKDVRCLDAATGKQLWSAPVSLSSGFASVALISGDMLVGFAGVEDPKLRGHGRPQGWKLSATGMEKAWEDEILPNDENLTVSFGLDRVYVQGREEVRALDLATGKRLATAKGTEAFKPLHGPGSNPWLCVVGEHLLLNPEGQHGGQKFLLMDRELKVLSAWKPPHSHDTAYAYMAMISPIVDGRIFVRGNDGLYCYDLRAVAKATAK